MPKPRDVMRILGDELAELIWPTRCACCGLPGELVCDACRGSLPWIAQRWACPSCGAPFGYLTCTGCAHDWELHALVCALDFEGAGSRLATVLKDAHETRLAPVIAAAIACALDEAQGWDALDGSPRVRLDEVDAICFVPATSSAYARRGFDHMELIAHALAQLLGVPVLDCLVRDEAADQRKLGREERAENLAGSVSCVDDVSGLSLLLADDVVTTGATMRACARALHERGATMVTGCALCRVW